MPKRDAGRATRDDKVGYETRRQDLRPEVRSYAEKLHARIKEIYAKYGAADAKGMCARTKKMKAGEAKAKGLTADTKELAALLPKLEYLLDNEEFGPGMEFDAEKEGIRDSERKRLLEFFGQAHDVPPVPEAITKETLDFWKGNGFELRYWPRVRMAENADFPGWKRKPGKRNNPEGHGIEFYDELEKIKNLPENLANPNLAGLEPDELPGRWTLADSRLKPNYATGDQAYGNDGFVQNVLRSLPPGVLNPEASACLRNGIHPSVFSRPEFWDAFKTALRLDGVEGAAVRLPRAIEANAMGQGPGWHDTDTYEWCEETYGPGGRLLSGNSVDGGASSLYWYAFPDDSVGFRPLVIFPETQT